MNGKNSVNDKNNMNGKNSLNDEGDMMCELIRLRQRRIRQ